MLTKVLSVAALAFVALAQDENSPPELRGLWEGSLQSGFAQANPSIPNSYECLPGTTVVSIPHKVEIGEFDVVWGDSKEWKQRRGSSTWLFPASKGKKFTWSTYNQNIAKLRTSPTTLECYYMKSSGSGKNKKLTVITLGGAAYGWQDQCAVAMYKAAGEDKPKCEVKAGTRSPLKSTVVGKYTYKGAGSLEGSGAGSTVLAAAAAVVAAVMGARLL